MQSRFASLLVLGLAAVLLVWQSLFQVRETETAIRMQFGKIEGANYAPGLHLKWPLWIDTVRRCPRAPPRRCSGARCACRGSAWRRRSPRSGAAARCPWW